MWVLTVGFYGHFGGSSICIQPAKTRFNANFDTYLFSVRLSKQRGFFEDAKYDLRYG